MAGLFAYYGSLAPKTKNMVVAGGLTAFVFGVYFYTMRAVGGTDELQQPANCLSPDRSKGKRRHLYSLKTSSHWLFFIHILYLGSCVVATGGLHGDLEKTMQAFRLGGLIDGANYWFGASTTVVQIGDVFKILYLLKMLKHEAFGGSHCLGLLVWCWEQMKSLCRGLEMPFQGIPSSIFHGILEKFCDSFRARTATLRPNGPISRRLLADNATVLMVGDFVLVRRGVLRNMWIMGWRGRC
ncbi:hypothetical protein Golob_004050 [Gossypium lobatum]|uniref:Cytochrome c oxidase assembly factor 3 mitochondrial coiled-coil domain-containing protein n=1 Tax=Gossypium lobatum TaxID=34289 RepID=A0A7J8N076_9ROSI|nr:hypothetical protein [Gossypium lobatum]